MIDINELRQSLGAIQTEEVAELLDRLEAAEADALEQARLNGMGSEREAALMAKLEVAEKEVEIERMRLAACGVAALGYFEGCAEEYISASLNDVLALRAKIEAMEKQEPVAWTTKLALRHGTSALGFDACAGNLWGEKGVPLYATPGAQPEPIIPEGWKPVPIEVIYLYSIMCAAFVPMTPQQEEIALQLDLAKRAVLAAPETKS